MNNSSPNRKDQTSNSERLLLVPMYKLKDAPTAALCHGDLCCSIVELQSNAAVLSVAIGEQLCKAPNVL